MKFKSIVLLALASILAFSLAGCGSSTGGSEETVTVAVVNDYPPFEYKEDDKLTGYDVELVEAIAENQGFNVEWKIMKFDGIISGLQAEQFDAAVSAITIRDDRAEVVNFSDPYFVAGLSLVVAKDSSISSVEDLAGKTIVAKQGTTGLEKAKELAEEYGAEVKIMQDDTTLYLDVETGNVDALVNDFPSVAYKIKVAGDDAKIKIVGDKLTGEDYGIAVAKSNEELLEKFNNGLKELKDNGKFDEIFNKYFSTN